MAENKRNCTFDIAKAISIFFLVSSHAYWWHITYVFTTFYMALFFFISGYFLKLEGKTLLSYIKGKILNLYVPFVIGSVFFLVFHNLFYSINITSNKYSVQDSVKKLIRILFMNNSESLLIPIWFIAVLFIVTVLFGCIYKAFYHVKHKENVLLAIGVMLFVINAIFVKTIYWYCYCTLINCVLSSFIFLAAGYFIKEKKYSIKVNENSF